MKNIGKRIMGSLTALIMLMGLFCTAYPVECSGIGVSDTVSVNYGSTVTGSDGSSYNVKFKSSVLFYNDNGSTYIHNETQLADAARKYLILTSSSTGETDTGYCIEFCARLFQGDYHTGRGYMDDTTFFINLPDDVKKLILASVYYGRNGINKVPVAGANDGDFYFATQTVIWEIQQQLRTFTRDDKGKVTGTQRVSSHGMEGDFFYRNLAGRPAEKCYNYIIERISNHYVLPSFVGETPEKASPISLKYQMKKKEWAASVSKEGSDIDFHWNSDDIQFNNDDTHCSFKIKDEINGEKVVEVKRKSSGGSASENLLVWHNKVDADRQIIATGSASPPVLYLKFKTDIPAETTISKVDSETGRAIPLAGTSYKIKSVDLDGYISQDMARSEGDIYRTDKTGSITIDEKLQAGSYILEEITAPKGYTVDQNDQTFAVTGRDRSLTVKQDNKAQMGIITIKKTGEYKHLDNWADIREKVMGGIDFDIIALDDIVTADGEVRAKKGQVVDTVRTDMNGSVSTVPLYLGPYNVVEKDVPVEYRISEPINIALVYDGQDKEIIEKKINILNRLKREGDSLQGPKTGDDSNVNTALMTMLGAATLILIMSVTMALKREK